MSTTEKTLRPGEVRFVPKARQAGRKTLWDVYDRARGSYPALVAGYGRVPSALESEAEALAQCEALAKFYAGR